MFGSRSSMDGCIMYMLVEIEYIKLLWCRVATFLRLFYTCTFEGIEKFLPKHYTVGTLTLSSLINTIQCKQNTSQFTCVILFSVSVMYFIYYLSAQIV